MADNYDSWLSELAQDFLLNPTAFGDTSPLANNAHNQAQFKQQLQDQPGMSSLYAKGITPNQLVKSSGQQDVAMLDKLNAWNQADHGDTPMPADLQEFSKSGKVQAPSEGGNSDYQLLPKSTDIPGVGGYDPFNKGMYKDPNKIAFDPNNGLVTPQSNQKSNAFMDSLLFILPSLMVGGMFSAGMGAATAGTLTAGGAEGTGAASSGLFGAGNLVKVPGLIGNITGGGSAVKPTTPQVTPSAASTMSPTEQLFLSLISGKHG